MKIPVAPPTLDDLLRASGENNLETLLLIAGSNVGPTDAKDRYIHWDKLRHLPPPSGYTPEQYWLSIRHARRAITKTLPGFIDKNGQPFGYCIPDVVMRDILWIGENATGAIQADTGINDPKHKQTYLINTLIEEAISSSQLEGAATTRRVAKDMIRTGRAPKNHSEQMILNNYHAMSLIREFKDEPFTPSLIFELHKILTDGTLSGDDASKAGTFRDATDDICVYSKDDVLLHVPPPADELPNRLQKLCDFANSTNQIGKLYVPPIIKAIIVHFMIGYDHPFVDGNGRTARALFYWLMAKEHYWLMEYISISRIIKKSPADYMRAYLYTETDSNDLTYFIVHQLDVVKKAIVDLHGYLAQKTKQLQETESVLENSDLKGLLNFRQISLLRHALKSPGAEYTFKSHKLSHDISYQTARTDLLDLAEKYKILRKSKSGKTDVFIAPAELNTLIRTYTQPL